MTSKTRRLLSKLAPAQERLIIQSAATKQACSNKSAPSNWETLPPTHRRIEGRDSPLRKAVRSSQVSNWPLIESSKTNSRRLSQPSCS
jgi:hypothetical protein